MIKLIPKNLSTLSFLSSGFPLRAAMAHKHDVHDEVERLISIGSSLRTRKNFTDAIPYFRKSLSLTRLNKLSCSTELRCSNGLMSSLRQTGPPGLAEAESLIDRALDIASNLGNNEVKLCLRAYLNVGLVYSLKRELETAVDIFKAGEDFYEKNRSPEAVEDSEMQKIMINFKYCAVQALQCLMLCAEESDKKDSLQVAILTRLNSIISHTDANFDLEKAFAHQELARFYEQANTDPDAAKKADYHHRTALSLCGVQHQSLCAICLEPMNTENAGTLILTCCHVYHR